MIYILQAFAVFYSLQGDLHITDICRIWHLVANSMTTRLLDTTSVNPIYRQHHWTQPSSAAFVHTSNTKPQRTTGGKPQKHTGGGIMNFGMDDINMYSGWPVMNGINGGVNNSLVLKETIQQVQILIEEKVLTKINWSYDM